jgi:hypothetical protein
MDYRNEARIEHRILQHLNERLRRVLSCVCVPGGLHVYVVGGALWPTLRLIVDLVIWRRAVAFVDLSVPEISSKA